MIKLTGSILGEQQLDRSLTRLIASTQDFSIPLEKVGEDIRDINRETFDAEGYGWEHLSPSYGAWKLLHYPGKTLLRLTDRFYLSMTTLFGEDSVSEISPLEGVFGARGDSPEESGFYGKFHQLGTSNMPQRKVIDLREENKRLIAKTVQIYWVQLGPEAGFTIA